MKFTQDEIDYLRRGLITMETESMNDPDLDDSIGKKLDRMEEELEDEE